MRERRAGPRTRGALGLLLRLDGSRVASHVRHPAPGAWVGIGVPLALVAGLLWALGRSAEPDVSRAEPAVLLGMLVAGPTAFFTAGALFRGGDDPLLRRLGVPPLAIYTERSLRLLGLALGVAALLLLPFASAGIGLARPLALGVAAAVAAWASGAWALSAAALAMARHPAGRGWGCLAAGMWDRELAAAAPLVWAPLVPFLAGTLAAGFTGAASGSAWGRVGLVVLLAGALASAAARWYARALPRFAPRVLEMAFDPPPPAGSGELALGRGVARLVPRRVAAAWARDAVIGGRRFAWATRVVWPVAILGVVALARWGDAAETRVWVAGASLLALVVQGAAAVGLGRLERAGPRWIDRSVGLGRADRLAARWLWGWGLSLWLTLPVALAWQWWSGAGDGWVWIALGGASAAVAALASVAAAGWR